MSKSLKTNGISKKKRYEVKERIYNKSSVSRERKANASTRKIINSLFQ